MATAAIAQERTSSETSLHDWLKRLLEQTAAAFGKTGKLTELECEAHLRAWADLVHKVGRLRFERGLQRAISRSEFFPRLGAIESHVSTDVKLIGKVDPECRACRGSGWERVFSGRTVCGKPVDLKVGAVQRCACYSVEAMGER